MKKNRGGGFLDVKYYKMKNIKGDDFTVRGTWERDLAVWMNENNILWIRKLYLQYEDENAHKRTYSPDFFLPDYNKYIEVKGYFSEKDKKKIKLVLDQLKLDLSIVMFDKIKKIKDNSLTLNVLLN